MFVPKTGSFSQILKAQAPQNRFFLLVVRSESIDYLPARCPKTGLFSVNLEDQGKTNFQVRFEILTRKEVRKFDFCEKLMDKDD